MIRRRWRADIPIFSLRITHGSNYGQASTYCGRGSGHALYWGPVARLSPPQGPGSATHLGFRQQERQSLAETQAQVRGSFRFTSTVARGLRESAIIALAVLALVMFVALASYNAEDPSFSYTGNSSVVHNRIGPVGAYLADVLFFLFGRPAFLFPVMLAAACWALHRR